MEKETYRESFNRLAGLTMGALAPIVATKYVFFPNASESEHPVMTEILAWGLSIGMNVGSTIATMSKSNSLFGFPLVYTISFGGYLGNESARKLRERRFQRLSELEVEK